MENKNQTLFEIHTLCPFLAILQLEGRHNEHHYAIVKMSVAYVKSGFNTGGLFENALAYLKQLAQVEKETLAKFTIKGVENA